MVSQSPNPLTSSTGHSDFFAARWFLKVERPWNIWVFPKIGGKPPKWMVKIMENPVKIDDLGVFPYFWKHQFVSTRSMTCASVGQQKASEKKM